MTGDDYVKDYIANLKPMKNDWQTSTLKMMASEMKLQAQASAQAAKSMSAILSAWSVPATNIGTTAATTIGQYFNAYSTNPNTINATVYAPGSISVTPTVPQTVPGAATLAPRGFNKYVNASDLLEEFIAYLGTEGVRKGEVMGLPLELFIKWLVIRACEEDQEDPGIVLVLPPPKTQPRCLGCGKWMVRTATLLLHGPRCAESHFGRQAVMA